MILVKRLRITKAQLQSFLAQSYIYMYESQRICAYELKSHLMNRSQSLLLFYIEHLL